MMVLPEIVLLQKRVRIIGMSPTSSGYPIRWCRRLRGFDLSRNGRAGVLFCSSLTKSARGYGGLWDTVSAAGCGKSLAAGVPVSTVPHTVYSQCLSVDDDHGAVLFLTAHVVRIVDSGMENRRLEFGGLCRSGLLHKRQRTGTFRDNGACHPTPKYFRKGRRTIWLNMWVPH